MSIYMEFLLQLAAGTGECDSDDWALRTWASGCTLSSTLRDKEAI